MHDIVQLQDICAVDNLQTCSSCIGSLETIAGCRAYAGGCYSKDLDMDEQCDAYLCCIPMCCVPSNLTPPSPPPLRAWRLFNYFHRCAAAEATGGPPPVRAAATSRGLGFSPEAILLTTKCGCYDATERHCGVLRQWYGRRCVAIARRRGRGACQLRRLWSGCGQAVVNELETCM